MTEELLKDDRVRDNCIVSFQNTGKENDATLDFLHSCELRWKDLYGVEMIWLEYDPDQELKFQVVNYETAHRTGDESKPPPSRSCCLDTYLFQTSWPGTALLN
jgi:hypothetical protein